MLGAHYYPWYGKPAHSILGGGEWNSGYTNHPILGEYDSRDPAVIKQHIAWANEAGIDFFIMNWIGSYTWDDITLRDYYLSASRTPKIKFCIHYDSYQALNKLGRNNSYDFDDKYTTFKTKGEKFLEDFAYLADTYFSHPSYLRIGNRPWVMIYVVREFKNAKKYFEKLKIDMRRRDVDLFLVADVVYWSANRIIKRAVTGSLMKPRNPFKKIISFFKLTTNPKSPLEWNFLKEYFKGITGYNMYQVKMINNFLGEVDREYKKFHKNAQQHNLIFIPTIASGYDDRNLLGLARPILERNNGEFYKDFWEIATKYIDQSLKMVVITSFNEWHEGTEIEPSSEYGKKYLKITRSKVKALREKE